MSIDDGMSPVKEPPKTQRKPMFSRSWIEMLENSKSSDDSFLDNSETDGKENEKLNSLVG